MSEYVVDTFGIVQDFADLHGDMNTPLYQAIMNVMLSRQRDEIVRCKDCECYEPNIYKHFTCELFQYYVEPDGFCAWGVRRETCSV